MLWYKRFASVSVGREVFSISPLAHLIYTVSCDMVARAGKGGAISAEDLNSPEYLARMCNLRLAPLEDIQQAILSDSKNRKAVLMGALTDSESLMEALRECVKVGLIKKRTIESQHVYVIEGFTDENPFFLPPETVKKRKQREISENTGNVPGQYVDSLGNVPGKREREERKRERKKEKQKEIVADATGEKGMHQKLTNKLADTFQEVRGSKYLHQRGKDGVALKELLKIASEEEILSRWARGLKGTGWHQVSTFAQLRQKWNDLANPLPVTQQLTPAPKRERFISYHSPEAQAMYADVDPRTYAHEFSEEIQRKLGIKPNETRGQHDNDGSNKGDF